MGQTCSTDACCNTILGKNEVRSDLSQMSQQVNPSDINANYRPMELSESQRKQIMAAGAGALKTSNIIARVIKI